METGCQRCALERTVANKLSRARNAKRGRPLLHHLEPEFDIMKHIVAGAALALAALTLSTGAEAKGCIKGALVGGVAGHMAGHGVVGAAAGCAIGRHRANKADKDSQAQQQQPAR